MYKPPPEEDTEMKSPDDKEKHCRPNQVVPNGISPKNSPNFKKQNTIGVAENAEMKAHSDNEKHAYPNQVVPSGISPKNSPQLEKQSSIEVKDDDVSNFFGHDNKAFDNDMLTTWL